jgi:cyclohexyl-isocyanide hydratase
VTGGGVTAGIDFGLRLAAELAGETAAKLIALGLEYDPEPPFRSGHPDRADPALVAEIRRRFEARLEREGALPRVRALRAET